MGRCRRSTGWSPPSGAAAAGCSSPLSTGSRPDLFFLVVAPESNSAGMHLKALARISRLVKDERFRRRLLEAEGIEGLTQVLREEDEHV